MAGAANDGLIALRPRVTTATAKTIIVSGLARSGTSMVASILHRAGLFLGARHDGIVLEDHDLVEALGSGDLANVRAIVKSRDAAHAVWGFKRPHLHLQGAAFLDLFQAPHIVLTFRDPVAIAGRNMISEGVSPERSLIDAVNDLRDLMRFAEALRCPTLLISYEKAIARPTNLLDALFDFTGLRRPVDTGMLLDAIEPERPAYLEHARRHFEGYVDGIDGSVLRGWGRQLGVTFPERFTLFADGEPVRNFVADQHRTDLHDAGIGDHAFAVDIGDLHLSPATELIVRVADRTAELVNSRRSVAELSSVGGG